MDDLVKPSEKWDPSIIAETMAMIQNRITIWLSA